MNKTYRYPLDMRKITVGHVLAIATVKDVDPQDALPVFVDVLSDLAGLNVRKLRLDQFERFMSEAAEQFAAHFQPTQAAVPDVFMQVIGKLPDLDDKADQ